MFNLKKWAIGMAVLLALTPIAVLYLWAQQTPMNAVALTNSKVDSSPIGATTPSTGNFTNVTGTNFTGTFNGPLNGNATTATTATNAQHVPWTGVTSPPPVTTWNWQWAGQGGQPSWLWGSNDGALFQVYNPANFSVNYANSANTANVASSANAVAWANVSGKPYPVTASQTWNWSPQGSQTYLWGTPDGNNMYPYNPANFSVNYANSAGGVAWGNVSGKPGWTAWNFAYSGQSGQPTWALGTNDGQNWYVWNPTAWNVNSANTANSATSATNATNSGTLQNYATSSYQKMASFGLGHSCTTGTTSYATCQNTWSIPGSPFGSSFNVTCNPTTTSGGFPVLVGVWPTGGNQFATSIMNGTSNGAVASSFNGFACVAIGI